MKTSKTFTLRVSVCVLIAASFFPPLFAQDAAQLTVRVLDAESNQPIAARLVLQDSAGNYPGDRLARSAKQWPNIEAHAVYISGEKTFDLPIGQTQVAAARGPEYKAEIKSVDLKAGEPVLLEFKLVRVFNMPQAGWVSGDAHAHMVHGENERKTSYQEMADTAAGNGLNFLYVCEYYMGAQTLDLAGFEKECEKVSTKDFRLFVGGEHPKSILGHHAIIGVPNPFIIPDNPPYYKAARAVHAQGGILYYVHPIRYFPGKQYEGKWLEMPGNNLGRELLFEAHCGPSFDGLSVLSDEPSLADNYRLWFNLLNRGFFIPVFADSDACFDRKTLGLHPPGFWSTYFYVGPNGPTDHKSLAEAVRQGRTMATTGPLVLFDIDNNISGSTIVPDGKPHTVHIQTHYPQHAWSLEPGTVSKVELIRNGEVVHAWNSPEEKLTWTVTETMPCWYVVRVYGTDQRWQVGLASPIYFSDKPRPSKTEPFASIVRGRIYDFKTGQERAAKVEIRRGPKLLKSFPAKGQFKVRMPLDADIIVQAEGAEPLQKDLLFHNGPLHKFMWYLKSDDLGKTETIDRFESLVREVDYEFPVGYKMPGCYLAQKLEKPISFESIRILDGPEKVTHGTVAIAAVLLDVEQIDLRDSFNASVIYRDEGDVGKLGPLVLEARAFNPSRPALGALNLLGKIESNWTKAVDLGGGYKLISGNITLPAWVDPGPNGSIEISARARSGNGDAAFIGLDLPIGPTKRALMVSSAWPTMPSAWPDGIYGMGPLRACNRIARTGQSKADYRQLHFEITTQGKVIDLCPARDGLGCADADDAVYRGHFLDQVLNDESQAGTPDLIRPQPTIKWNDAIPLVDATKL